MPYPQHYRYTREHEWIHVEGDTGTVGITDHAQKALGDIVYVELPQPGARCQALKPFGTVESVKAVSELYAPVSGEVLEINEKLKDNPELVNQDPHGEAWMIKLRLADPGDLNALLSAQQYEEYIRAETEH